MTTFQVFLSKIRLPLGTSSSGPKYQPSPAEASSFGAFTLQVKWGTDLGSYAKNAVQSATTLVAGSELEKKLAEATSNEPWGASGVFGPAEPLWFFGGHTCSCVLVPGTLSTEIARSTYGYDDFKVVGSAMLLPVGTIRYSPASHLVCCRSWPQSGATLS